MSWLCTYGAGECEHAVCKPESVQNDEDLHALAVEAREIRLIAQRLERMARARLVFRRQPLSLALVQLRQDVAGIRKLSQSLVDRFGKADR